MQPLSSLLDIKQCRATILFQKQGKVQKGAGSSQILTAVVLVAAVRAVPKAVAAEAADDAMDAIGAAEERRGTLRLHLRCKGETDESGGEHSGLHVHVTLET